MRVIKEIWGCFYGHKLWFLVLVATSLLFIFLAWLAYPETFDVLVGLMVVYTLGLIALSIFIILRRQKIIEATFQDFLMEPNEAKEEILCQVSPPNTYQAYIREIGRVMRSYQAKLNEQVMDLTDYENYIEGWVHEMKKPLSLMTLVVDNRKDEMSPFVRQRMRHIRDQMLGDVGRILYFARLGAVHKDYIFESINLLDFCKQTIEDHQTLLDEAGFQIQFKGKEMEILSDQKGLAFILEQIIANSSKHPVGNQKTPILKFETRYDESRDESILYIGDNGPGVSKEDLPFIFDKGFTGERGTYTKQTTGMGLFLVSKMAYDLGIQLDAKSELGSGLTLALIFPHVRQ